MVERAQMIKLMFAKYLARKEKREAAFVFGWAAKRGLHIVRLEQIGDSLYLTDSRGAKRKLGAAK